MKIAGKKIEGRNIEIIPIIRPTGNIIFIAEAIESYDEFEKMMPMPTPPTVIKPGGIHEFNVSDPAYKKRLDEYGQLKTAFTIVTSLRATPDLVWDTIKNDNIQTYSNYGKE